MFDGEVGSLNKRKVSLRGKSGREDSAKDTVCECVCTLSNGCYLLQVFFSIVISLSLVNTVMPESSIDE